MDPALMELDLDQSIADGALAASGRSSFSPVRLRTSSLGNPEESCNDGPVLAFLQIVDVSPIPSERPPRATHGPLYRNALCPLAQLTFDLLHHGFLTRRFSTQRFRNQQQAIKAMAACREVIYLGTRKIGRRSSNPTPHHSIRKDQTPPGAERSVLSSSTRSTYAAVSSPRSLSHRPSHRSAGAETGRPKARRKTEIYGGTRIPPKIVGKLVKVGCSRGSVRTRQGQAVYAFFSRHGRFYHQVDLDVNASRNRISPDHVEYTSRLRGLSRCQIRTTVLDILKRKLGPFLDEDEA
ncbi:TLC domain-containing protein [Apiospora arundinis]